MRLTRFSSTLVASLIAVCWLVGIGQNSAVAVGPTPPTWESVETVAVDLSSTSNHAGADRILAYDHHGNAGIAFFDAVRLQLRFARKVPGVGWAHGIVDAGPRVGAGPSLAFDRHELPAISYYDDGGDNLKFAYFNGATWDLETVASTGNVGIQSSLAFDVLGHAAIAYRDFTNGTLKYVYDAGGDRSLADEIPITVPGATGDGIKPSLAFDPLNRPMVAHVNETTQELRFSVAEPGIGWITTTVDRVGAITTQPSIAIDPDTGFPAIAYEVANPNATLHYAQWDGENWNIDEIISAGLFPSLAFDPADGNPAIAYSRSQRTSFAWHDGSQWRTQTADSTVKGFLPSLAFNDFGNGFPSIAFLEFDTGGFDSVHFIEDPPAVPEPSTCALAFFGLVLLGSVRFRRRWCH